MDKKIRNKRIGILSIILLAVVIVVFFIAKYNISQNEQGAAQTVTSSEAGAEDTGTDETAGGEDDATAADVEEYTVFMTIECSAISDYEVADEIKEVIPEDYMILSKTEVTASAGDTAYDVLGKVCRDLDIQMESSFSSSYNSYYVEGIGHLYEGAADSAAYSGWTYMVNGEMPEVGASDYVLEGGEDIVWSYSVFDSFE